LVAKLISLVLVSFVYSAADPPVGSWRISASQSKAEISNSHPLQHLQEKD